MPWSDLLQALAIVLVWGVNFVVIKWGVSDVPPLLLGGLRFCLAAVPAVFFVRRPSLPWRYLLLYGLCVGVGQFACLFTAIKLGMPAGLASVVLQSQAFFTLILAGLWLRERWQASQMAGLLLALCGLALIGLSKGGSMTAVGLGLTIAAAFSWALSNVVVRQMGAPATACSRWDWWCGPAWCRRFRSSCCPGGWRGASASPPLWGISRRRPGSRWPIWPLLPLCSVTACGADCCRATRPARWRRFRCWCRWWACWRPVCCWTSA